MTRIGDRLEALRARRQGAFVAFIVAGDPSLEATEKMALSLEAAGADVLELGVPFSDPMADGASNQAAYNRALQAGVRLPQVFALVRRIRERSQMPILLMTYYNPVLQWGLERFAADCEAAGVDGAILTDLTPEEAGPWVAAARDHRVDTVFMVAPTSTDARMRTVAALGGGFIYCVSRTGVTGARAKMADEDLAAIVGRVRGFSPLPIILGFGISRPEHVAAASRVADGAIVGSALVDVIANNAASPDLPDLLAARVRELRREIGP